MASSSSPSTAATINVVLEHCIEEGHLIVVENGYFIGIQLSWLHLIHAPEKGTFAMGNK